MNKKAATHVVAFLLFGGATKMANNDTDVRPVANFSRGGMKGSDMISYLYGFQIGFLVDRL